jgi:hypothetical protein
MPRALPIGFVFDHARVRRWRDRWFGRTAGGAPRPRLAGTAGDSVAAMLQMLVAQTREYAIFRLDRDGCVS